MDEKEPLVSSEQKNIIYGRRWWILAVFSLTCFLQAVIWNTWGPIAQSAKVIFEWSDGQLGMLPNWGNIGFIATVFVASYLMDEKGIFIILIFHAIILRIFPIFTSLRLFYLCCTMLS